jgi:hypothetical protein
MAPTSSAPAATAQLDVVFDGTWIIVPTLDDSENIIGVEVYSPACGHPHAALFLPQLGPFGSTNWPQPSTFYMVDSHGLTLAIERSQAGGMPAKGIDQTANHCISDKRPLGGNWDLVVSITAGPDAWVSSGTIDPVIKDPSGKTIPCFSGKDAPTAKVSSIQTLSFKNVGSVTFCGAPSKVQSQIPAPFNTNGSLLFEGEVPYIPTLQHERSTVVAMATLAGLDLSLDHPLPSSGSAAPNSILQPRIAGQANCGHAIILVPSTT